MEDIDALAEEVSFDMEKVTSISSTLHEVSAEIEAAVKSIADKAMEGTNVSEAILKKTNTEKMNISQSIKKAEGLLSETSERLDRAIQNAMV